MGSLCHSLPALYPSPGARTPAGFSCRDALFYTTWLALALLLSGPARPAQIDHTRHADSVMSGSQPAQTTLSETGRARARLWGLSDTEWARYEALMQGIRGSISDPSISPLEVLGIHARDDDERRRYAERWAAMRREDTGRVLAFQRAYDAAWRRLFPDDRLFVSQARPSFSPADRLLYFVRPDCDTCDTAALVKLLRQVRQGRYARLDIYLLGVSEDAGVRAWARRAGIDPALVAQRKITLNHDDGVLARLSPALAALPGPHLIRQRGADYARIDPEAL